MLHDLTLSPALAFDYAISEGKLSKDVAADDFAGNYMYMGRDSTRGLAFKNIITRAYLYVQDRKVA